MGRRGKQKLPESLELLLDTMCNTFGGIMFIALSLIIISQIVSKNLNETSPEKRDKETIERLERSIAALQQEISDLKLARTEDSFGELSLSGEQKEYIRKIMENNTRISTLTVANKLLQEVGCDA